MTPARPAVPTGSSAHDPWEHYGWLMGSIWLVFLGFPLWAVLRSGHAPGWQACGIVIVVAYAVVYLHGLMQLDSDRSDRRGARSGAQHLVVMGALLVSLMPLIGIEAFGAVTFMVALAVLSQSLRVGAVSCCVAIVTCLLAGGITGEVGLGLMFAGICTLVSAAVLLVRVVEERQAEHQRMTDEQRLLDERDRVARDVHDVLGHSLTVVTLKAELAERLVDVDPERAKSELAEIRSMSRQALAEVRATVAGLRVARLTDELDDAEVALQGAGIDARLPQDPEVVDPRHRIVLAWSLRELVTNVVRHSNAQQCTVTWGADWLVVSDDGTGMGPNSKDGNGIRGLRERVEQAGGTVERHAAENGSGVETRVQL